MVQLAVELRFEVLESELEALLIEAELIRIHQPPYNTLLKDDKSPIYVRITKETYPKVEKLRKNDVYKLTTKDTILGPFPSSTKLNEVLRIARRIFPWCNQGPPVATNSNTKACFYHHLELCPGVCTGRITAEHYQMSIQNLILFLKGKKKSVTQELQRLMKEAVLREEFEKAAKIKQQIELITSVTSSAYRLSPDMILPSFQLEQAEVALLQLKKLIADRITIPKTLQFNRIEGYDVSNNQGEAADVSMVVFANGQANKSEYRLFNIKSITTPNDYQMLREAISRREKHREWPQPDLVVIDGGKGQLRSAFNSWQLHRPLMISIAKDPDRIIIPIVRDNTIDDYHIVRLPADHPALKLIQQVRDESHRFAKKQHHSLLWRSKIATTPQSVVFWRHGYISSQFFEHSFNADRTSVVGTSCSVF